MTWLTQAMSALGRGLALWVVIAPWEMGLRVRMGKRATVLHPGVRFRIPGLDRIYVQSARVRTLCESGLTLTTRDGKVLTISFAVEFAIEDIERLYSTHANPETTIGSRVKSAIVRHVGERPANDIAPSEIEAAARAALYSFAGKAGLGELDARVTSFTFSRAIRLLVNDYRDNGGLYNFETEGSGRR